MARYWPIAILAFAALAAGFTQAGGAKDKDFQVQGKLTNDDPKDAQRGGASQTHVVKMKAGTAYTIKMASTQVDSFLRLLDSKDKQLDEDDDSGGMLDAQIIFNCTQDGDYKVICTTVGNNGVGNYTLTVKTRAAVQPPATAHARMVGNAAPDFRADFAVNGKARKLSDFKGKVVLVEFCDVRSSLTTASLPQLNQWREAYGKKGLAIVGVTFYTSDINQALGFDKAAGKVVTVAAADRKSDQALLSDFAEHHKIEFTLLALPKKNALEAYGAYTVNGVPQRVLIDRKGVVRLIDVNGEKNGVQVEGEIKKLLEEK